MTDPAVIAAFIAAFASLLVAILGYFITRKNQSEVETLKAQLVEQQAERDARRDYEYEARKRLYHDYEPLLFQLVEHSQVALNRIYNLATIARLGKLLDKDGLACDIYSIAKQSSAGKLGSLHVEGLAYTTYYATATIYGLLAPLAEIKLMQHLLTFVDLTLDRHINEQYMLAKLLYKTLNDDFALARRAPRLEYDPDTDGWAEKRKAQPQIYWRQGLVAGELEIAVEALIVSDANEKVLRCMSFGEFEDAFYGQKSDINEKVGSVADLFLNFHPQSRPILWRILVTQAHIYKALLYIRELKEAAPTSRSQDIENILLKPISQEDRLKFDWRQKAEEANDNEVLIQPFEVAHAYLHDSLESLKSNLA